MVNFPAQIIRTPFLKQHLIFPILLALLLLPVLILLPWQSQKIEFEDHEQQLIADTLWVEQAIRFQLIRNEENLELLGAAIIAKSTFPEKIKSQFSELIKDHPELDQLIWLDATDHVRFSTHPSLPGLPEHEKHAIATIHASATPRYLPPYIQEGEYRGYTMDYCLPLFRHNRYIGSLIASYHLTTVLDKMVPWWFAKDNEVSLNSLDDVILARRADGGYGHHVYTHSRNLDLAGVNLLLKTNSFKDAPKLLSNYLVAAVVLLGLGLLWSVWALWSDVLRRQAAEAELRKQIAFRSAMENSLITGLRVRSLDGYLVYVNPAFCEMVGYTEQQLIGLRVPLPFWAEETVESFQRRTVTSRGRNVNLNGLESVYVHSSGRRIPVLIYESALVDEDGIQTGWMGSILDISDLKKAEQILRQHEERLQNSARLSTMGELASVMAHELNQPLAAISSYATGALNMMKAGNLSQDMLQPALVQMQNQAQRAGQIIRSVHDFVAKREPSRTKQQFKDVFQHILPLIELQAKSYLISLQTHIEESLPNVYVDSISLEQVILNLTRNALQAMQELTLKQRLMQIEVKKNGNYVQVDVIDHGTGIAQEVSERLFSPFFSTKAEGMGMGLNICRTIIEFHGGQLTHRANPTGGTIFSFTLPVIENEIAVNDEEEEGE